MREAREEAEGTGKEKESVLQGFLPSFLAMCCRWGTSAVESNGDESVSSADVGIVGA